MSIKDIKNHFDKIQLHKDQEYYSFEYRHEP